MKWLLQLSHSLVVVCLLVPLGASAQLSSTNYTVQAPGFSAPNTTDSASSTNYQVEYETGGLYIFDNIAPSSPSSGGSSGSRPRTTSESNSGVLGKLDAITICHSAQGTKYVTLTNVQVFITLAELGPTAALRGHDGHSFDIVPQFTYDLDDGRGVQTYPGKNWDAAGQARHADNCRLFLADIVVPPTPQPTNPPAPIPPAVPVPPVVEPIDVCADESQVVLVTTAIDENTLVSFMVPKGAARSALVEQEKRDYRLLLQVKPVSTKRTQIKQSQLERASKQLSEKNTGNTTPYGLVKKTGTQTVFTPPIPVILESTDQPNTTKKLVTVGAPDCEGEQAFPVDAPQNPDDFFTPVATPTEPSSDLASPTDSDGDGVYDQYDDEVIVVVANDGEFSDSDAVIIATGELITPIEVTVVDETGAPIESFEQPIEVEIFNPTFVDALDIVVLQPSAIEPEWHVVPHRHTNDTVTVELIHPGEIFIWILPRTAKAQEAPADVAPVEPWLPGTIGLLPTIPFNKQLLELITWIGFVSGLILLYLQLARAPFSFSHVWRNIVVSARRLYGLITFKKQRHPWGTVYDSETKAPLDPAQVQLIDMYGKSIDQAITDLDGRYGFLVPEGAYRMVAKKTNYQFPSQKTTLLNQDVLYANPYYGGEVSVTEAVTRDIPMDPVAFDWNQYEKLRTKQTRFYRRFDPVFVRLLDLSFILGVLFLLWQFISLPSVFSGLFLLLYVVMLWQRFHTKAPLLYGTVFENRQTVPYALVRVMAGQHEITRRVADEYGRYFVLVSPGVYNVAVERPLGNNEYTQIATAKLTTRRGIINANIRSK